MRCRPSRRRAPSPSKIFMTAAPAGRDDEFEGLCLTETLEQLPALQLVAETGRVCVVHAEDNSLISHYTTQLKAAGRYDLSAIPNRARPTLEAIAIALAADAQRCRRRAAAHRPCNFPRRADRAAPASVPRVPMSAAKLAHSTCSSRKKTSCASAPGALVNPPIRGKADQEALWDAPGGRHVAGRYYGPFALHCGGEGAGPGRTSGVCHPVRPALRSWCLPCWMPRCPAAWTSARPFRLNQHQWRQTLRHLPAQGRHRHRLRCRPVAL